MALKWQKIPSRMGYSLWYIKTEPSQNQNLSTSLERPHKKLLIAYFSFEIPRSDL